MIRRMMAYFQIGVAIVFMIITADNLMIIQDHNSFQFRIIAVLIYAALYGIYSWLILDAIHFLKYRSLNIYLMNKKDGVDDEQEHK